MESLLCAFESLGKAWPRNLETQRKLDQTNNEQSWQCVDQRVFALKRDSTRKHAEGCGGMSRAFKSHLLEQWGRLLQSWQ